MNRVHTRSLVLIAALVAAVGYIAQDGPRAQERDQPPQEASGQKAMQCPMMAGLRGLELRADSPAVLRARAEELELTEQQLQELKNIQQRARQQARELLTDEQRQKLEDDPEGPLSMMQLSRTRMQAMLRDGLPEGMCPMCARMMRRQNNDEGSPRRR